jgi:hypothetical protein
MLDDCVHNQIFLSFQYNYDKFENILQCYWIDLGVGKGLRIYAFVMFTISAWRRVVVVVVVVVVEPPIQKTTISYIFLL